VLAKTYETTHAQPSRSLNDLPTSTPQAQAFAKQLKTQGYRIVGPTSVYAFMQNIGGNGRCRTGVRRYRPETRPC
jgi:DNA-3-methyladenine glycosylase I